MDGTIIQQGRFTSTGNNITIPIRSDVDFMSVINLTQIDTANNVAVKFEWERNFDLVPSATAPLGGISGIVWTRSATGITAGVFQGTTAGFQLANDALSVILATSTWTNSSNVVAPVITMADITGLAVGDIMRIQNTSAANPLLPYAGMDFEIGTVTPGVAPAGTITVLVPFATAIPADNNGGNISKLRYDGLYRPKVRFIASITQGVTTTIATTVQHRFEIGQEVRFHIPNGFGMLGLDGLRGTVTATPTTTTFVVDVNTTAFGAFVFNVLTTPHDFATVIPYGEDTAQDLSTVPATDILSDATRNIGVIGMTLIGGAAQPGGALNDVMFWKAGKSFNL